MALNLPIEWSSKVFYEWGGYIIDYILPKRCSLCYVFTQDDNGWCSSCWRELNFVIEPYCCCCGRPFTLNIDEKLWCAVCLNKKPKYNMARTLFKLNQYSKRLIHRFKYHDQTSLAEVFAKLLYSRYREIIDLADLLIPVPMHRLKRLVRYYNQAQILAKALSKLANKPLVNNVLLKGKWTRSQTGLTKKFRETNVVDSFSVANVQLLEKKKIILIDDVITTGSTINACANILKKAGALEVIVLAIATT